MREKVCLARVGIAKGENSWRCTLCDVQVALREGKSFKDSVSFMCLPDVCPDNRPYKEKHLLEYKKKKGAGAG